MTKRVAVPYRDIKLKVVGPTDDFFVHRVQRLDLPATIPSTTINELGNPKHAGVITDIPELSSTFQIMDVSPKTFAIMTGNDINTYPASGIDVSNLGFVDLVVYIKQANVAENLKCIHARHLRVTGFDFTYSVDGESTEEYTVEGSEKRYFAHDIVVDKADSFPILSNGTFILTNTPITLKNGNKLLSCIADGEWLTEGTDYTVSGNTVTFSLNENIAVSLLCVYHANANMAWSNINDTTVPAAIRGKNISVKIGSNTIHRVQNVSIRGTFPSTRVEEMGNVEVVGYVVDPPNITGDISIFDTDNEIVALLSTGNINGNGETEYGINEYTERTLPLEVIIKDPTDNNTVLKTIYIPEMRITSDGFESSVGGQTTLTLNFESNTAECIVYSGARV